jgi:hypothetical protein
MKGAESGKPKADRETAIAIPDDLLTAVDRVAQSRGEARNRLGLRALVIRQA